MRVKGDESTYKKASSAPLCSRSLWRERVHILVEPCATDSLLLLFSWARLPTALSLVGHPRSLRPPGRPRPGRPRLGRPPPGRPRLGRPPLRPRRHLPRPAGATASLASRAHRACPTLPLAPSRASTSAPTPTPSARAFPTIAARGTSAGRRPSSSAVRAAFPFYT